MKGKVTRSEKDRELDAEGESRSDGFWEKNRTCEDECSLETLRGTMKAGESRERRRKRQRLCSG